jgi:hypothetical protein
VIALLADENFDHTTGADNNVVARPPDRATAATEGLRLFKEETFGRKLWRH